MDALKGKNIVLGITGGISAYKAAELTSQLVQGGANVTVILTASAQEFIRPLTFQTLTSRAVITDLYGQPPELSEPHIVLGKRADILVIAPATANIIAKLAQGMADDVLTCTALATRAPILIAPAMSDEMYHHASTQRNLATLRERGCEIIGPGYGRLASGEMGWGRLLEPDVIVGHIKAVLGRQGDLAGLKIIVTAGGTQESIDPVRVITNRSSGKMGYALAEAARDRGAVVTLICATTALPPPPGVEIVTADSAVAMMEAVLEKSSAADVLIMAAAVADFRPAEPSAQKIKRSRGELTLRLVPTVDILGEVSRRSNTHLVKVGFAAESEDLLANARQKLVSKGLDLIVANDIGAEGSGFGSDTNKVMLVDQSSVVDLPLMPKYEVAHKVLDAVRAILAKRSHPDRSGR